MLGGGIDGNDQLTHELVDLVAVGCLVDDATVVVLHPDGARTPSPRVLREVVLHHREVERPDERLVDDRRVSRELKHVGHRVAVALDGVASFLVGIKRLLVVDDGCHVLDAGVVALDAVRPLDGARQRRPPQCS